MDDQTRREHHEAQGLVGNWRAGRRRAQTAFVLLLVMPDLARMLHVVLETSLIVMKPGGPTVTCGMG